MHSSRMRTGRSSSRLLGGVCLSACWDRSTPPGVGLETPVPDPLTSPLGVGLETPGQTPQPPCWVWAEFLTHASENITLPQLRCGR